MRKQRDRLRAERTLGQYREHVDELTRVEHALRRSGENLRIVLGAAPVALVLTRLRDQHVVLANERCAALFEVPLSEVIGQRTRDYYENPEERDVIINKLVQDGQLDSVLVRLKKRSGAVFWAELSARIVELDGQRCSLVGIFDVTAQKNLEEQLRVIRRDATEHRGSALEQLAKSIAGVLPILAYLLGAIALLAGAPTVGLWALGVATLLAIATAILYSWVVLVEVLR